MNKTSEVLIYRIPFSRSDKFVLRNISENSSCINAKKQFSAGLYFCSLILKKDFDVFTAKYVFNSNGKPFLNSEGYGFSISYTDDYVYVAVVRNEMVGIDAEKIKKIDLDVSKEFMTERELINIEKQVNKYEYFYKIWTLKEAYVKLIGVGIDNTIGNLEFSEDGGGEFFFIKKTEPKTYFNNFTFKDCIISIASFSPISYKIIDFGALEEFFKKYDN